MADYRSDDGRRVEVVERRSGLGTVLVLLVVLAVVVVAILFATGFFSARVTREGSLPDVSVKGGAMPEVDVDSKEVVVGTKKTTVEVPTVGTKKETIDVPVVGTKDDDEK